MKKMTIKRVTKTEFETEDGRVFEHPMELDEAPTVAEFQRIYDFWVKTFEKIEAGELDG